MASWPSISWWTILRCRGTQRWSEARHTVQTTAPATHASNMIKIRGRTAIRASETHLEVMCDLNVYLSMTRSYIMWTKLYLVVQFLKEVFEIKKILHRNQFLKRHFEA